MNIRSEWADDSTTSLSQLFYTKEETISSVVENFNYRRFNSAEGHSVTIGETVEQVIIQDHTNPLNENKTDKKMLVSMDSVAQSGKYVVYRNDIWLICSHMNIVDDAYKSCQIFRCNYTLKFQNSAGTILTYPAIFEQPSSIGLDENKVITTTAQKYTVRLPLDDETKLLKLDKRFLCDYATDTPSAYEITKRDAISGNYGDGTVLELTLTSCERQAETIDRVDLMIADYIAPSPTPIPNESGILSYSVITCSGNLNIGGSPRTLTPAFYNSDNTVNTGIIAVWNCVYPVGFESYFTKTDVVGTNKIKIGVANNYDLIGKMVEISVSDGNGGYIGNLILEVGINI